MNIKTIKSILLTTSLTLGLSMSVSVEAHAATHAVVQGDSLYEISKAYNTTVSNLMVSNNMKSYDLNIGQTINIPEEKYIVNQGDTLFLISQKHNISLFKLRQANNVWTNHIFPGQVLEIPNDTEEKFTTITVPAPKEETPVQEVNVQQPVTELVTEPVVEEPKQKVQAYSAEELDLLARLIMAETESQPYEAKVAVGAVVMNRVKSGLFQPTISGVINEKINGYYQFTPVENGWIKRAANEECIRAAKEALSGVDNTNGSLFYYDDSTTNQWILSKPVSVQYGRMIYAY